jgi:hypothetical protein
MNLDKGGKRDNVFQREMAKEEVGALHDRYLLGSFAVYGTGTS